MNTGLIDKSEKKAFGGGESELIFSNEKQLLRCFWLLSKLVGVDT